MLGLVSAGNSIELLVELHVKHFNELDVHVQISRILANIATTSNPITIESLMFHHYLERLHADMNLGTNDMIAEAVWAVSNLVADSPDNCKRVVENAIFEKILQLSRSNSLRQRKEALIALSYIVTTMKPPEVMQVCLLYVDVLATLADGLEIKDQTLVVTLLKTVEILCTLDEEIGLDNYASFTGLLE